MGACNFRHRIYSEENNINAAFNEAVEEAYEENGDQEGFSGDIQTVDGFKKVSNPNLPFGSKEFDQWESAQLDKLEKRECIGFKLDDNDFCFIGWGAE